MNIVVVVEVTQMVEAKVMKLEKCELKKLEPVALPIVTM